MPDRAFSPETRKDPNGPELRPQGCMQDMPERSRSRAPSLDRVSPRIIALGVYAKDRGSYHVFDEEVWIGSRILIALEQGTKVGNP